MPRQKFQLSVVAIVSLLDGSAVLEVGRPQSRTIATRETHSYRVPLAAGQYVVIVANQHDADIALAIVGPDGTRLARSDNPDGETEEVVLVAERAAGYRVEVSTAEQSGRGGRYDIAVVESKTATPRDRARAVAQRKSAEGRVLYSQRTAESLRGAIASMIEVRALWQALEDRIKEGDALDLLGQAYKDLGEKQKALESLRQALPLRRLGADRRRESNTLTNIGAVHDDIGEKQQAIQYYSEALPITRSIGFAFGEAAALLNLGKAHADLGDNQRGLDLYTQALAVFRRIGHLAGEAVTLNNLGKTYDDLDDKQRALDSYRQALPLRRTMRDLNGEGVTLNNLASVYRDLGERETSLAYYDRALAIWQKTSNIAVQAVTLSNVGRVYYDMGDYPNAIAHHGRALELRRAASDAFGEAVTLNYLGMVYAAMNDRTRALDYFSQALPLRRQVGDRKGLAITLDDLGKLHRTMGNTELALACFSESLALRRDTGDRSGEAESRYHIAQVYRDRGEITAARAEMDRVLAIVESLRAGLASHHLRASYFATMHDYYDFQTGLFMQLHDERPGEGFDVLGWQTNERARGRSLLETLAGARADLGRDLDANALDLARSLQRQLNTKALARMRLLNGKHTSEQEAAIDREIEALTAEYQHVDAALQRANPRYGALNGAAVLGLHELQQLLDEDALLLQYDLGPGRSHLWAISRTSIAAYALPKAADIELLARRVYDRLTAQNDQIASETLARRQDRIAKAAAGFGEAATALSAALLGPVASQLGAKRLLIVADGVLQYIPFAALPEPSRDGHASHLSPAPLMLRHEIVSLPSASVLAVLRRDIEDRPRTTRSVAVLADPVFNAGDPRVRAPAGTHAGLETNGPRLPRLPLTLDEAAVISQLVPRSERLYAVGFDANRELATSARLGNYGVVHFATHALLDTRHPELSGVVLSLVDRQGRARDGFLRLHDIYNLRLSAELVVLSACQTALGQEIKGEGLIGLTRGFMYAGAPRVLATLWKIDDRATAEFMKRFYEGMLGPRRLRPAEALRAAQAGMWETDWRDPYYWAGFVLQGEWK